MKKGEHISATLKGAAPLMSKRDREVVVKMLRHYTAEFRAMPSPNAESAAYSVHVLVDDRMQAMLATSEHAPHIACRKGCAACCHQHVDVFPEEAALLHTWATQQGIEVDAAKLARQAEKTPATWSELSPEDRACVFLGPKKECRVHEHRPSNCRKYLVRGDPEWCDSIKHPGNEVGIVFDVEAEVIHSAAMTGFGVGSMARQLMKHRRKGNA